MFPTPLWWAFLCSSVPDISQKVNYLQLPFFSTCLNSMCVIFQACLVFSMTCVCMLHYEPICVCACESHVRHFPPRSSTLICETASVAELVPTGSAKLASLRSSCLCHLNLGIQTYAPCLSILGKSSVRLGKWLYKKSSNTRT